METDGATKRVSGRLLALLLALILGPAGGAQLSSGGGVTHNASRGENKSLRRLLLKVATKANGVLDHVDARGVRWSQVPDKDVTAEEAKLIEEDYLAWFIGREGAQDDTKVTNVYCNSIKRLKDVLVKQPFTHPKIAKKHKELVSQLESSKTCDETVLVMVGRTSKDYFDEVRENIAKAPPAFPSKDTGMYGSDKGRRRNHISSGLYFLTFGRYGSTKNGGISPAWSFLDPLTGFLTEAKRRGKVEFSGCEKDSRLFCPAREFRKAGAPFIAGASGSMLNYLIIGQTYNLAQGLRGAPSSRDIKPLQAQDIKRLRAQYQTQVPPAHEQSDKEQKEKEARELIIANFWELFAVSLEALEDHPGSYEVQLDVSVTEDVSPSSKHLGVLTIGTRVSVLKVVNVAAEQRVRARIAKPLGWIDLKIYGTRWAKRERDLSGDEQLEVLQDLAKASVSIVPKFLSDCEVLFLAATMVIEGHHSWAEVVLSAQWMGYLNDATKLFDMEKGFMGEEGDGLYRTFMDSLWDMHVVCVRRQEQNAFWLSQGKLLRSQSKFQARARHSRA